MDLIPKNTHIRTTVDPDPDRGFVFTVLVDLIPKNTHIRTTVDPDPGFVFTVLVDLIPKNTHIRHYCRSRSRFCFHSTGGPHS